MRESNPQNASNSQPPMYGGPPPGVPMGGQMYGGPPQGGPQPGGQ